MNTLAITQEEIEAIGKKLEELWQNMKEEENANDENNFIDIFEQMYTEVIMSCADRFTLDISDLKYLVRCQKGNYLNDYERLVPKEEYCKKNRWNPDGVAFLYLGFANENIDRQDINIAKRTCFEESRTKDGDYVTVCEFAPTITSGKIINLCYELTSYSEINEPMDTYYDSIQEQILKKLKPKCKRLKQAGLSDNAISGWLKAKTKEELDKHQFDKITTEKVGVALAKILLKILEEYVVKPINDDDVESIKEYLPFRYFAKYLRNKGYLGIIYKSTRMNLLNENGMNVVLFNKNHASYVDNTMQIFIKEKGEYKLIKD